MNFGCRMVGCCKEWSGIGEVRISPSPRRLRVYKVKWNPVTNGVYTDNEGSKPAGFPAHSEGMESCLEVKNNYWKGKKGRGF